jgi:hypothetical protein
MLYTSISIVAACVVSDPEAHIVTAAIFFGHGRLDTTGRYARPSEDDLARGAERVQGSRAKETVT